MFQANKIIVALLCGTAGFAHAQGFERRATQTSDRKIGVGVAFSGPVGISLYGDLGTGHFVQGGLGFWHAGDFALTGDYAFSYPNVVSGAPTLAPYWGVGAVVLHDKDEYWINRDADQRNDSTYIGGRIPLGVNWVIPKTPVQLSAELAPTVIISPATYSYLQGGLAARVLF